MAKATKTYETLIATYTVEGILGEGGAGRVLAVVDDARTQYALKVLAGNRIATERLRRFRNEIGFCKREIHNGIVRIVDDGFIVEGNVKTPFYVMPRFHGTLRKYMVERLPPDEALRVFVKILDAVEAAHLHNVWHRDLKPENILVGPTPLDLVVADFGIAHFSEDQLLTAVETRDDSRLANFAYAAPEQRQRGQTIDHRADLFTLGLMLNELFTSEIPHGKEHKTVASVAPHLGYLDTIIDDLLKQTPAQRLPSVAAIKQQLNARGLEFAVRQKIADDRSAVVPVTTPTSVPDIGFTAFDYKEGHLLITLDRDPPAGWMNFFHNPPDGHTAIVGYEPSRFGLQGRVLSIQAPDRLAEQLVVHAREYARKASLGLTRKSVEDARRRDEREREAQRARIAEETKRADVLARLNKLLPG